MYREMVVDQFVLFLTFVLLLPLFLRLPFSGGEETNFLR